MVKFLSQLVGSKVVLFQEMARVGDVAKVLIDPKSGGCVGFEIMTVDGKVRYIPPSELKGFGKELMLINDLASLSLAEDVVKINKVLPDAPKLIGFRVVDGEGHKVGRLEDVTLNLKHLELDKLYVQPTFFLLGFSKSLIISAKKIIKIEKKKVFVDFDSRVKQADAQITKGAIPAK